MKVQLREVAFARSGDKGDTANIGLIAFRPSLYPLLVGEVTAERVKRHFEGICHGEVERFELPNLHALNFLLHESLGGGGTVSLMLDAQGKTFATALLRMEIEVPDEIVSELRGEPRNEEERWPSES
ncbi:MAG: hypothetical protein ACE5HQ_10575 [Gemmatimonadota bacterium]